jgi:hypothetical protein
MFLRYNWQDGSLHNRPTRDLEAILERFKVAQSIDVAKAKAANGCQWHLGPQVAYLEWRLDFGAKDWSF